MKNASTAAQRDDEIARAEAKVQERKAELSRSLRRAANTGNNLMQQVRHELTPALQTVLVVAGAVAVVSVATVAVTRRRRRGSSWLAPEQPSPLGTLAKTAGIWALRLIAKRVAQELVSRLDDPTANPTPNPTAKPAAARI